MEPIGYGYSPQNQGGDDSADSDVGSQGRTAVITLAEDETNTSVDAGLIDNRPDILNMSDTYAGLLPGDDPDGAGPLLSIGVDVASRIADIDVNNLPDGTTLSLASGSFDAFNYDANGKTLNIDATAGGVTLAGVTIDGGTVNMSGTLSIPGGVQVNAGSTLGGNATVDGDVNTNGGTVAPGNSPGVLTTGNKNFASGATFEVEIGGVSPGNGTGFHDQLVVNGSVTIDNSTTLTATLFGGFTPSAGDDFIIINNDGADGVTGTFINGLAEGAKITVGNYEFTVTYAGGDGNDVELQNAAH